MKTIRNAKFDEVLSQSRFLNLSRLARHLRVSYRNVQSYALLERRPVDRHGVVKYDAAAICRALGCTLEDLFPEDFIDQPYAFRETYGDGHGRKSMQGRIIQRFPDRSLTKAQASALNALLDMRDRVPAKSERAVAEKLISPLPPEDFGVLALMAFEGMSAAEAGAAIGVSPSVARRRYEAALRKINAPSALRIIRELSEGSQDEK